MTAQTLLLSHSSCTTIAAQEKLAVPQLASPLAFPASPFLSPVYHTLTPYHALSDMFSHVPTYVQPMSNSRASNFVDRRWFWKSKLCPRRSFMPEKGEAARFVLDTRGGHVACATECEIGLALVEYSPEKSTEGHHDAFATRVEPDCTCWIIL